jgi:hypothetical protein
LKTGANGGNLDDCSVCAAQGIDILKQAETNLIPPDTRGETLTEEAHK